MKTLVNGIRRDIIQSNKYKTNRLVVKFITPYRQFEASVLHLITRMMEDGSNLISSKGKIETILADLYGSELSINVQRRGNFHELTLATNLVRIDLIDEEPALLAQWLDLVKDLLFNQTFEVNNPGMEERFKREKILLIQAIERQKDNKARLAHKRLYEELYQYEEAAYSAIAQVSHLEDMTLEDVKAVYKEWLQLAEIVVLFHGEVEEDWFDQELETWPVASTDRTYSYDHNNIQLLENKHSTYIEEQTSGKQGNLMMAFKVPHPETFNKHMKLQLANTLFGQSPTSQLFTQVREKQSLAYSIGSSIDVNRGLIVVAAGIDSELGETVATQIVDELNHLIEELQEDDHFQKIKLMLISNMVQSIDSQANELNYRFREYKNPIFKYDVDHYTNTMNQLTAEEVKQTLQTFELVQTFFLKGVEKIDEKDVL